MAEPPKSAFATEAEEISTRVRLKEAREAAGKSPSELAHFVGDSKSAYYDLENHNGELYRNISLGELSGLCDALGLKSRELFSSQPGGAHPIGLDRLCSLVTAYLARTGFNVSEFEERVGFVIEPALNDHTKALDWNVDCLWFVCNEIGTDWLAALPS